MGDEVAAKKESIKPPKKITAKNTKKLVSKPKGKAGAKGKYLEWITTDGLLKIGGWAHDGLTDAQIAKNIGISPKTLIEWKNRFPELCNAIKENKEIVDRKVENAMLKSALGYSVMIKKAFKVKHVKYKDGKRLSEDEEIVHAEEEVHIPANTTAQIFWLTNRMKDIYKHRQQIALGGSPEDPPIKIDWADEIKKAHERIEKMQAQEP